MLFYLIINNLKNISMKLITLNSLESLNNQELQFIIGGTSVVNTEVWADSASNDCYKCDHGGNSAKKDHKL